MTKVIADLIVEIQRVYPTMRVGQILSNAAGDNLFYINDAELIVKLKELLAYYKR